MLPRPYPVLRQALYTILGSLLLLFATPDLAQAQLGKRLGRAAQRGAERALERNSERKTDKAVDDLLNPKRKRQKQSQETTRQQSPDEYEEESDEAYAERESSDRDGESSDRDGENTSSAADGSADSSEEVDTPPAERAAFSRTSKFDFEAGAEPYYFDDFERVSIGDAPLGYNTLGGLEVVTVNSAEGKWLKLDKTSGQVVLYEIKEFPEDFTLEFDLIVDIEEVGYRYKSMFGVLFASESNPERITDLPRLGGRNLVFWIQRGHSKGFEKAVSTYDGRDVQRGNTGGVTDVFNDQTRGTPQHISIWRQGRRLRMYINDEKAYDLPLGWTEDGPIGSLRLVTAMSVDNDAFLVSNIRVAKGKPDTRSKLETEGRLVTYGITFASGSHELAPASAATLKQIVEVLEAKPDMRLRITGHTDSDGDETSNQALSERRAAAVVETLTRAYGIDAARLESAGKGESSPIAPGDSPAEKARNRRVELDVI